MPINNGNNGNNGNSGLIASSFTAGIVGEAGGGWFIEDRVDLPFVTEPPPLRNPENLPELAALQAHDDYSDFENTIGETVRTKLTTYDERQWTAQWGAWRVLDEFARLPWYEAADEEMTAAWAVASDPTYTRYELLALARAARDERASALPEILSQHVEFITDFMALLSMTPGSHPATYRVLHIASHIGSYAALHYKAKDDWSQGHTRGPRPRPSHLSPALMPPVPVPGHPAFPSGHATQSWLMALSITYVLEEAELDETDGPVLGQNLRVLARRIARNREIAGLHYPSDSTAGRQLAQAVFAPLCRTSWFNKAVEKAVGEWKIEEASGGPT